MGFPVSVYIVQLDYMMCKTVSNSGVCNACVDIIYEGLPKADLL